MKIVIIEPFLTGSHAQWADGYVRHSTHDVEILGLPGSSWKWRMQGGAVRLSRMFLEQNLKPDLILATDMLDTTTFLSLTRDVSTELPIALYFHENQLTYPWSPRDKNSANNRTHYGFVNYTSALASEAVFFNSEFHRTSFLDAAESMLKQFPDYRELENVQLIAAKSSVVPVGLDFSKLQREEDEVEKFDVPLIVWNHRWEHDKNPVDFFRALSVLKRKRKRFRLAVLGENSRRTPEEFEKARTEFESEIVHWGYVDSYGEYVSWLRRADILPVTSIHDFFGVSVAEAIYCGSAPLLPRRLAYPELIGAESDEFFYESFDDLVQRLGDWLSGGPPNSDLVQSHIARFGWEQLAPVYDRQLEQVANLNRASKSANSVP